MNTSYSIVLLPFHFFLFLIITVVILHIILNQIETLMVSIFAQKIYPLLLELYSLLSCLFILVNHLINSTLEINYFFPLPFFINNRSSQTFPSGILTIPDF